MKKSDTTESPDSLGSRTGSPVERLARCVGMPVEHVQGALEQIAKTNRINRLQAKLRLIKERRAAITPKGEIVEIGTPGSKPYHYGK